METDCDSVGTVAKKWGAGAEDLLQSFPLHRACRDGDLATLTSLLGDAVVSVSDAVAQDPLFGWTPAHWAAHNGKVECLQLLVQAGLPCDVATQGAGLTLAHVSALEGQSACLFWLCQNGISVNAQDHMGETAAHKAVRCGSVECLHILREHGADFSLLSTTGANVLDLAIQNQQRQCVDYFRAGGDASNHMTGHVTHAGHGGTVGGRRKRLTTGDEDENGDGMMTDVAKRARVDNDFVPSANMASNGFHSVELTSVVNRGNRKRKAPPNTPTKNGFNCSDATNGTMDGTISNGIDSQLKRLYVNQMPLCQPFYARRSLTNNTGRHENGFHDNGSKRLNGVSDVSDVDDAPMMDGDCERNPSVYLYERAESPGISMNPKDVPPAMAFSQENMNGTNGVTVLPSTTSACSTDITDILMRVAQGNLCMDFNDGTNGVGTSGGCGASGSGMTNGAFEHGEMVRQSAGYDNQLLESIYNYDAMPCSHAY